jgi:Na+/H+-translocating membrane pyrophosphatase
MPGIELTTFSGMGPILLPLVIAGVGVLASIIGTFFVRIKSNDAKEPQVQKALDTGNWAAILLTLGCELVFNRLDVRRHHQHDFLWGRCR